MLTNNLYDIIYIYILYNLFAFVHYYEHISAFQRSAPGTTTGQFGLVVPFGEAWRDRGLIPWMR